MDSSVLIIWNMFQTLFRKSLGDFWAFIDSY